MRVASEQIEFRSDVTVELVRHSASDADVLFAARVSTQGEQTLEAASSGAQASERDRGLISSAMPLSAENIRCRAVSLLEGVADVSVSKRSQSSDTFFDH